MAVSASVSIQPLPGQNPAEGQLCVWDVERKAQPRIAIHAVQGSRVYAEPDPPSLQGFLPRVEPGVIGKPEEPPPLRILLLTGERNTDPVLEGSVRLGPATQT